MLTRLRAAGQFSISVSSLASGQPVVAKGSSVSAVVASRSSLGASSPLASSRKSSSSSFSSALSSSCGNRGGGTSSSFSSSRSLSCATAAVSTRDLEWRLRLPRSSEFHASSYARYTAAAAVMEFEKIKVENPVVEMDGTFQTLPYQWWSTGLQATVQKKSFSCSLTPPFLAHKSSAGFRETYRVWSPTLWCRSHPRFPIAFFKGVSFVAWKFCVSEGWFWCPNCVCNWVQEMRWQGSYGTWSRKRYNVSPTKWYSSVRRRWFLQLFSCIGFLGFAVCRTSSSLQQPCVVSKSGSRRVTYVCDSFSIHFFLFWECWLFCLCYMWLRS